MKLTWKAIRKFLLGQVKGFCIQYSVSPPLFLNYAIKTQSHVTSHFKVYVELYEIA